MKLLWRLCEIIYGMFAVVSVGSLVLLVIFCELRLAADWLGGGRGEWLVILTAVIAGCCAGLWMEVRQ